jgi:predicted nucleotidyltransferase
MKKQILETINKLKEQFSDQYQERLSQIVLFGSQARNEAEDESDIDLLIVLKGEVNPVLEIKKNNAWICNFCLETDELINCIYLSEKQFQTQNTPLLRNIRKEGILL